MQLAPVSVENADVTAILKTIIIKAADTAMIARAKEHGTTLIRKIRSAPFLMTYGTKVL